VQSSPQERYIRDVVAGVKAGDTEAYDEIVSLFRDEIYAIAWRLTRCADDAQDIVQEVFLRAYRALSGYRGNSAFRTWLHRIALTTGYDYLHREKKRYAGRVWKKLENTQTQPHSSILSGPPHSYSSSRLWSTIRWSLYMALAALIAALIWFLLRRVGSLPEQAEALGTIPLFAVSCYRLAGCHIVTQALQRTSSRRADESNTERAKRTARIPTDSGTGDSQSPSTASMKAATSRL